MQTIEKVTLNGLNTEALGGLVGLLKDNPQGGRVTFQTNTIWQDGARAFTHVEGHKIDGQMQHQGERQFVVLSDEPSELSGTDTTLGPVEALMYAMGSCIAATTNSNASLMGVQLNQLEVTLESEVDLHGMFDLDRGVRPGIGSLRAHITIAGDADPETLRKIAQSGYQFSPVRKSVVNGVDIQPDIHAGR
jgi:uncharacterized OsmC-like protein